MSKPTSPGPTLPRLALDKSPLTWTEVLRRWSRILPRNLALPLLTKELQEQAQQRWTYLNRVLFCVILYTIVLSLKLPTLLSIRTPFGLLGKGKDIFDAVSWVQFIMVLVFMPLLCCGVISHEKEQNTLQLLLLTRLSPWTIVLQKFLSRIFAMGTYLLASLPLLVLAYPLGGITSAALQEFIVTQVLTILWIGAISVCCSAWCTTPHSSLILTYLVVCGITGGFCLFILSWMFLLPGFRLIPVWVVYADPLTFPILAYSIPPFSAFRAPQSAFVTISIPPLIQVFVALALARVFVVSRAAVSPQNPLLKFFRSADAWFHRMNANPLTQGIELIKTRPTLPEETPVAWRERTRSVVGSPTHLTRLFFLFTIPLGMIVYLTMTSNIYWTPTAWSAMVAIVWIPAILIVQTGSTVLIPGEINRQTLDVLLSTPMSSRDILLQKRSGVLRLMGMFFLVFVIMTCVKFYVVSTETSELATWVQEVWTVACFWIYLSIVSWLAIAISLFNRKLLRSLILSTLILLCWLSWALSLNSPLIQNALVQMETIQTSPVRHYLRGIPLVNPIQAPVSTVTQPVPLERNLIIQSLFLISPLGAIWPEAVSEKWSRGILEFPLPWVANLALHGMILWILRTFTLRTFARRLGRLDPQTPVLTKETA